VTIPYPRYIRMVATRRCNLACHYCHLEGEERSTRESKELPLPVLISCIRVAARAGVRKFKLVGGEPFLRRDLPAAVGAIREAAKDADISIITAGVVSLAELDAALEAGLDRVNVTIHGFTPTAMASRVSSPRAWETRSEFVDGVIARGLSPKLNYVFSGPEDLEDLDALLDFAAAHGLLVNVLDNLAIDGMSWRDVARAVRQLRGEPDRVEIDPDPYSLPTQHWSYLDELRVEIKHTELGRIAPYSFCRECAHRGHCREGVWALRLGTDGVLAPCLHRRDLGVPLARIALDRGEDAAFEAWYGLEEAA